MNYIERLKKESNNATDYIYKKIKLKNNTLEIVNIETITSSSDINNFILKRISYLDNLDEDNLKDFLYNYLKRYGYNITIPFKSDKIFYSCSLSSSILSL